LIANTQRQEALSTMTPPSSGPTIAAIPPQAVQVPIAAARSRSGNAATMIASALGVRRAPAAPCSALAAIRASIVGASAHATENTPNRLTPSAKIRRSP
jgi:hypothetical protein